MNKFLIILSLLFSQFSFGEGFLAGTLVHTSKGCVPIESLEAGDSVLCYSLKHQEIVTSKIQITKKNEVKKYLQIKINYEDLLVDENQKFYVNSDGIWLKAKDLKPGQFLGTSKIDSITPIQHDAQVCSLSVRTYHNYFVTKQKILTHNFAVVIPIFTYVIGEKVVFASAATIISAIGLALFVESAKNIAK